MSLAELFYARNQARHPQRLKRMKPRRHTVSPRRRTLLFEPLEPRLLLSTTGLLHFLDAAGHPASFYGKTEPAVAVEVLDADLDTNPGTADTAPVSLTSTTESAGGVTEPLLLTETGPATGIFHGTLPLGLDAAAAPDGVLAAAVGDTLTLTYLDAADDFGNPGTVAQQAQVVGTVVPGGTLAASTTWALAGAPYLLTGDLSVNAGTTLTVEPGVTVLFLAFQDDQAGGWWSNKSELIVNSGGTLTAIGTAAAPITFTALGAAPQVGDWGGIRFESWMSPSASGTLRYVEVRGAEVGVQAEGTAVALSLEDGLYRGNQTGIEADDGAAPTIRGNQVTDNTGTGIYLDSAPATVSNNTVSGNSTGIYATAYGAATRATLTGNTITGNRSTGVQLAEYGAALVSGNTITGNSTGTPMAGAGGLSYSNWYTNTGQVTPLIQGNTITGNQGAEVVLSGQYAQVQLTGNNLYDPAPTAWDSYDLSYTGTAPLDARFNYWGPTSTAEMDAGGNPKNLPRLWDGYDSPSYGKVNYAGWLVTDYVSYPTAITLLPKDSALLLLWDKVVGAGGYEIQYGTASGIYDVTIDAGDVDHYLITGLSNFAVHYLVTRSYDPAGTPSPSSAELVGVPAPVGVIPGPDLAVASVLAPQNAQFGQSIEVTWTVSNVGNQPATSRWSDRLWLSRDTVRSAGDISLMTQAVEAAPLAVGTEYTRTATVTLPFDLSMAEGMYYIIVQADALGTQPESEERNNVGVSEAMALSYPPLPDLVPTALSGPPSAVLGERVAVRWTVTNQGELAAPADWTDTLYLSADEQFDYGDRWLAGPWVGNLTPLEAGASYTINQDINIQAVAPGAWFLLVVADGNNGQGESNESNNVLAVPLTLSAPDLAVTALTAPASAVVGERIVVRWTVTNQGGPIPSTSPLTSSSTMATGRSPAPGSAT
jgi:parallel beta-helix repeat protein